MAMKKRHHASTAGKYEGREERRRQEMKDAGMITEDHNAIANMPQEVRYHDWPGNYRNFDADIDDTISGINRQMDMDESTAKRHNVPKKW
jgi:hypothetical protein